jgi:hypothetical protein
MTINERCKESNHLDIDDLLSLLQEATFITLGDDEEAKKSVKEAVEIAKAIIKSNDEQCQYCERD